MVFGWLMLANAVLITPGLFLLAALFVLGADDNWLMSLRILGAGLAFSGIWCVPAIKALVRGSQSAKYAAMFSMYPRMKIAHIAKETGKSLYKCSVELNRLKRRGYFKEMSFDLDNKEVVFAEHSDPLPHVGNEGETVYKERSSLPTLAIATAAITVVSVSVGTGILPLVIFAVLVGLGSFFLVLKFFPAPVYFVEVKRQYRKPAATGNVDLDEALGSIFESRKELARLSQTIVSPKIREPLAEILRVLDEITAYVTENQDKLRHLRQFVNYYLPTTTKFLQDYEELEAKPDKGENIRKALSKIEGVTGKMVGVFKQEYDDLFGDRALDISAEVSVMQSIIKENEHIM
jgi:5-bromo-4-chloroindolyl phosphate hydrolysis protein